MFVLNNQRFALMWYGNILELQFNLYYQQTLLMLAC